MASKKLYDLAVVTGSYTSQGETKNRYANVGAVMQSDDGNKFIMLNRHFNPAGVPFREGAESILVSMFKPKDADGNAPAPARAPAPAPRPAAKAPVDDGDVPF